jgi:hypothetical protein
MQVYEFIEFIDIRVPLGLLVSGCEGCYLFFYFYFS